MQTGRLRLAGLKSAQCADAIAHTLAKIDGVDSAKVSFDTSQASVSFDENRVSLDALKHAVERAGYQIAAPAHGEDGACCGGCGG